MKISIRQTRRGDWLVFEARPAHRGIGMTTGTQYGREPGREAALAAARQVAAKYNGQIVEYIPCNTNPPGELRPIPWGNHMYRHLRREELPLDEHGRPITGYCRYLLDGTCIEPERATIVEAQIKIQFSDEVEWKTRYFIDLVDGVMYTLRQASSYEGSRILYHSDQLPEAISYMEWLMGKKTEQFGWEWRLDWK